MANVLARRFLRYNILKLIEHPSFKSSRQCASFYITNINRDQNSTILSQKYSLTSSSYTKYVTIRTFSKKDDVKKANGPKLSLFQRFKQMYRDYWYVLVPVHLVTSAAWFGGFYYLAKSGVDIPALLEAWSVSEKITNTLKDSSMGYIAVSYALYKIATPARYAVTLGGTTVSINYLKKWGYIKPVPSKDRLKEMFDEKKDNIMESVRETKEGLKMHKNDIMDDVNKSIKKMKETGSSIKNKTKL